MKNFTHDFFGDSFPLSGQHLIAASAGTGKTYNMQNVFARLAMLEGLRVTQILVVTFTEAATAELCDRLRRVLANVLEFLAMERAQVLAVPVGSLDSARKQALDLVRLIPESDWGLAKERVIDAIANFDQAAISTIHGFCNRVLNRYAFESGASFGSEVGDFDDVCILADDAWRRLGKEDKAHFEKYGKDSFCPGVKRLAATQAVLDESSNQDNDSPPSRLVFSSVTSVRERQRARRSGAQRLSYDDLLLQVRDALRQKGEQLSEKLRAEYSAVLIDEFQDTDPVQYEIFHRIFWENTARESCRSFVVGDPKQAIYAFRGGDIFMYRKAVGEIPVDRRYELKQNFRSTGGIINAVNQMFADTDGQYTFGDSSIAYSGDLAFNKNIKPLRTNGTDDGTPFRIVETASQDWWLVQNEVLRQVRHLLCVERPEIYDAKVGAYRLLQASDIAVLVTSNEFGRQVCQVLIDGEVPAVCMAEASVFASSVAHYMLSFMQMLADPSYMRQIRGGLIDNDLWGLSQVQILQLSQEGAGIALPTEWNMQVQNQGRFTMSDLTGLLERRFDQWSERGFGAMFSVFAERTGVYRRLPRLRNGERLLTDLGQLIELIQSYENENGIDPVAEMAWFAERIATASDSNEDEQQRLESDENAVVVTTVHKAKGLEFPVVLVPITKGAWVPRWRKNGTLDGRQWLDWQNYWEFKPEVYASTIFASYHAAKDLKLHVFSRLEDIYRDSERNTKSVSEITDEHLRLLYVSFTRAAQRCVVIKRQGTDLQCDSLIEKLRGDKTCSSAVFLNALSENPDDAEEGDGRLIESEDPRGRVASPSGNLRKPQDLPNLLHDEDVGSYSSIAPQHGSIDIPPSDFEDETEDEEDRTSKTDDGASRVYGQFGEEPMCDLPLFRYFPGGTDNGTRFHRLFERIPLSVVCADEHHPDAIAGIRAIMGGVPAVRESADDGEVMQSILRVLRGVATVRLPSLVEGSEDISLGDVPAEKQMHEWKFNFPSASAQETTSALFSVIERFWRDDRSKCVFMDAIRQCTNARRIPNGWMTGSVDLLFEQDGRFYVVDWKTNILGAYRSEFCPEGLIREMARYSYFLQYLVYSAAVHQYLKECLPGYSYERHFGGVHYVFVRAFAFDEVGASDAVFSDRPPRKLLEAVGEVLGLKEVTERSVAK